MFDLGTIASRMTAAYVGGPRRVVAQARMDPAVARPAPTASPGAARPADLEGACLAANRTLDRRGTELTFEFDTELDRVIVRLVDTATHQVVRQLPTAQALAIARALVEEQTHGVLLHAQG